MSSCPVDRDITYFNGLLILVIQIVAITGNCLFFVGIVKFPRMRNVTNIFLCCLAFSDIVVALIPMSVTFAIYICQWGPESQQDTVRKDITTTYLILDISCGTASVLSLTVIAMDRYFAINWPFLHERVVKAKTATATVVAVWVVALVTSLVRLDETLSKKHLTLTNIIITFIIPIVIMAFCYINIAIIARRQSIRIAELNAAGLSLQRQYEADRETTSDKTSSKYETSVDERNYVDGRTRAPKEHRLEDLQCNNDEKQERRETTRKPKFLALRRGTMNAVARVKAVGKELKAAKTLGIVMGVFIITWTPFMSLNIISYIYCYPYTQTCSDILTRDLVIYIKLLHYLSSALNPCLYVLLNRNWRQVFRKIICCCAENRVAGESRFTLIGVW